MLLKNIAVVVALLCLTCQVNSGQSVKQAKSEAGPAAEKIKVLIVDGQNNHGDWPKITAMTKSYLEASNLFSVDVMRTKYLFRGDKWLKEYGMDDQEYELLPKAKTDPNFKPNFSSYGVVISNFGYKAAPWPDETKKAFEEFVAGGGGFVSIHAADNSFPKWAEYNKMTGIGGWDGRNEKSGPYVYYDDEGKLVRDESKGGGGGHGPQHEFPIVVRDSAHPIMKGMPKSFLHSKDELYERLRGPAENMKVLATAYASKKFKGSGRHEPMVMTVDYGKGRIFHTTLGHADYSCECVGMITLLLRGTQWAATGQVTIPIPDDFPSGNESKKRDFVNNAMKAEASDNTSGKAAEVEPAKAK
jgi:type 1 glutamine amidotransferase